MKVSVVIPTYNEEGYIAACLKSVFSQIDPADEVIVIDNNNVDKTSQIARKMGARVVLEKKQGMIPARNAGFNAAKYDIIARIDADTIVPPDWIKRIKNNFETFDFDALSGPLFYYDSLIKSPLPVRVYSKVMKHILKNHEVLLGTNMALTKDIWLAVRDLVHLEDAGVHEDLDLSMQIIKVKGKIRHDRKLVVGSSARRIKSNPSSFFVDYPKRLIRTLRKNSEL